MDDTLLIDAVERLVNGEMSEQERIYFEDLRKNHFALNENEVGFFDETVIKMIKYKMVGAYSIIAYSARIQIWLRPNADIPR